MLSRRTFLTLASGLLVPAPEPVRAYSFAGGWALPRWQPVLFKGSPVFQGLAPLAIWDIAPGELFSSTPHAGLRVGTHAELDKFAILGRGRRNTESRNAKAALPRG